MSVSRNFLTQPFDPSLGGNWTAGQAAELTQFLQLATPDATVGATLGWIIISASSPNVVTYPELVNFLWLKPVSAGVQELYAWNGTSWQMVSSIASIADGSIALTKLQTVLGDAGKVIKYSVTGVPTAVSASALFGANTINYDSLVNAPAGANYILLSDEGTGVWSRANWSSAFQEQLSLLPIPVEGLSDVDGTGAPGQVPAIITTGDDLQLRYVEDLLRDNQTPTNKLTYPAGSAGKMLVVTSSGLDVQAQEAPMVPQVAVLRTSTVTATANNLFQDFADNTSATQTIALNTAATSDPDSLLSALTGTSFTLATVGTYLIDVAVQLVNRNGTDSTIGQLQLYNTTGASVALSQNVMLFESSWQTVPMSGTVDVSVATTLTLRFVPSANASYYLFTDTGVGLTAGNSTEEVFVNIRITRIA